MIGNLRLAVIALAFVLALSPAGALAQTSTPAALPTAETTVAATVTGVIPALGRTTGATIVVVTGENFMAGAAVFLNGQLVPTRIVGPRSLSAVVPAGLAAGSYDVTVRNLVSGDSAQLLGGFRIMNEASVAYVPIARREAVGSNTEIHVHNVSGSVASIRVFYYDAIGRNNPEWTDSASIEPGRAMAFDQRTHADLPIGFDGSAVVQATADVRVIVNHTRPTSQGEAFGSFSAASSGATELTLPVLFAGANGYRSTVSVQNTSARPETYSLALYPNGSAVPIRTLAITVQPLAAERVRLGPAAGVPENFVGVATLAGSNPSLVAAVETTQEANGTLLSYAAISRGESTLYAALLFKNASGWRSGAQIVNVSIENVMVAATLWQRDGDLGLRLPTVTLLPHESHTYYLPDLADMPDGVWSGRFDASGNIALVVQQLSGASGMAYTGFGEGTGNISVPLTFKRSAGWDAGIQVQNVGNTETAVAVVHYSAAGGTTEERATIPVGRSKTFYLPGNADLADGHMGAALINSSNGQPIVAIVNLVNPQRAGDAAMVYEGINY